MFVDKESWLLDRISIVNFGWRKGLLAFIGAFLFPSSLFILEEVCISVKVWEYWGSFQMMVC